MGQAIFVCVRMSGGDGDLKKQFLNRSRLQLKTMFAVCVCETNELFVFNIKSIGQVLHCIMQKRGGGYTLRNA